MSRHSTSASPSPGFRLLFVCTGNICRSPFAELLTRHLLVGRLGGRLAGAFGVSSAGVHAVVAGGMHPDSRDELAPWGLDRVVAGRFVARQLRPAMVDDADLVLGASLRHRSAVVEYNPAGLPKTFGLLEFARLAGAVDARRLPSHPVDRAHALVDLARRQRGLLPPVEPDEYRIPDPISGTKSDHHRAAVLIREAVSGIVDLIAPAQPAIGPIGRAIPSGTPLPRQTPGPVG